MDQERTLVDALTDVAATASEKRVDGLPELPEGESIDELAINAGKGDDWVRTRLKALIDQGKVKIGKKRSHDLNGRPIWKQVYKLLL